jgi:hypothetical protein
LLSVERVFAARASLQHAALDHKRELLDRIGELRFVS